MKKKTVALWAVVALIMVALLIGIIFTGSDEEGVADLVEAEESLEHLDEAVDLVTDAGLAREGGVRQVFGHLRGVDAHVFGDSRRGDMLLALLLQRLDEGEVGGHPPEHRNWNYFAFVCHKSSIYTRQK